jgi:tetratricopeptide (TPR) repeat protein
MAAVYDNQGKYDKALLWYQKALVIVEKVLGKERWMTVSVCNSIAEVHKRIIERTS